eukprot:11648865-Alexandrium_andersonii.AAC.1
MALRLVRTLPLQAPRDRRRSPGPRRRPGVRALPRRPSGPSIRRPTCAWTGGLTTRRVLGPASVSPRCRRCTWTTRSAAAVGRTS